MHSIDADDSVVPCVITGRSSVVHDVVIVSDVEHAIVARTSPNIGLAGENFLGISVKRTEGGIGCDVAHTIRVVAPTFVDEDMASA